MKSLKPLFFIFLAIVMFSCGSDDETVSDTTSPIITLLGDATINVAFGVPYVDVGATASDNVDGNISANIIISNPVDVNILGTYTVTYSVSDSSGNSTSATRTVNVIHFFSEADLIGDWRRMRRTYTNSDGDLVVDVYDECEQMGRFVFFSEIGHLGGKEFVGGVFYVEAGECYLLSDEPGEWELLYGNKIYIELYDDSVPEYSLFNYTILELTDNVLIIESFDMGDFVNYTGIFELERF